MEPLDVELGRLYAQFARLASGRLRPLLQAADSDDRSARSTLTGAAAM
jgi:hypothetical protein